MKPRARLLLALVALLTPGCALYCPLYATSGCLEVRALDALGARGAHDRLIEYLGDERSWVREESAGARLADPTERRYVRAEAARALGRLGAREAAPELSAAARPDAAPELKLAVLEALCGLDPRGPDTQAVLQRLADDEDILVAAVARHRRGAGCGS